MEISTAIKTPPIDVLPLFRVLDDKLINLLRSLSANDWNNSTIAKKWTVKDIAAHLLDGNFRTLSLLRDGHKIQPVPVINSYQELLNYLNGLNADWVNAAKRFSPQLLVELLETSGKSFTDYLSSLDLFDYSLFPVAWAGESQSYNWFHIAREYTEKFIHQQQIRHALFNDSDTISQVRYQELMTHELYFPFIQTFMFALPQTFRDVVPEEHTIVEVNVSSEIGGQWQIEFNDGKWKLVTDAVDAPDARCELTPDLAWKVFSKGISPSEALKYCKISGNEILAGKVLDMVSVMA